MSEKVLGEVMVWVFGAAFTALSFRLCYLMGRSFAKEKAIAMSTDKPLENEPEPIDPENEEDDAPPISCAKQLAHETIRRQHRRGNIIGGLGGMASLGLLILAAWGEYRKSNPTPAVITKTVTNTIIYPSGPAEAWPPENRFESNTVVRSDSGYGLQKYQSQSFEDDEKRAALAGALIVWSMLEEGQTNINMTAVVQEAMTWRTADRMDFLVRSLMNRFPNKLHDMRPR